MLPPVEEYMMVMMDYDIIANPQGPCMFHNEKHGKSLVFSIEKQIFSCFGACALYGGNVVRLHMLNKGIKDYKTAELELLRLFGGKSMSQLEFKNYVSKDVLEPYQEEIITRNAILCVKAQNTLPKLQYLEFLAHSNLSIEDKELLYERLVD